MAFKKATKHQAKLRLALVGPSGSGKTFTALRIAKGLGGRVAVIDTERGSASKYAGDVVDFDVLEPDTFSPRAYCEAIREAEKAGYDVLIIDSLSHAWSGKGGALEMVDNAAKRSQSGNTFMAWRDVTPEHNALVDTILGARMHVIATMRAKTEYVLEEDSRGKKMPRKIGLAPVQRDGMEYEFDLVADINTDHDFIVSKSRCQALDKLVIREAGEDVAERLRAWLTDGAAPEKPAAKPGELDEYGLRVPTSQCPRFSANAREHANKPWSAPDVAWIVAKHLAERGEQMTAVQREWAEYLVERRARRKEAEEQEAAERALAEREQGAAQ